MNKNYVFEYDASVKALRSLFENDWHIYMKLNKDNVDIEHEDSSFKFNTAIAINNLQNETVENSNDITILQNAVKTNTNNIATINNRLDIIDTSSNLYNELLVSPCSNKNILAWEKPDVIDSSTIV